ncbi:uncharacterized protein LOC124329347 isoform X3 [Daphnia pulicaria]|uniref:uncharacterized protein LOC124329347 isoform X3 n=1 Tax=Daphnia pulicaria TaxID=35523 RepID=UPI001EECEDC6|nr:uncharacterized protein LOC124329347 isoform X3 [Daphnia pulicaria]
MPELNQNLTLLHDAVPKSSWQCHPQPCFARVDFWLRKVYFVSKDDSTKVLATSLLENTMNIRNPKSDWLEYELVSYLNPHDLKSLVWASERKFQAQNCKMQQLWLLRNREEKETISHLPLLSFIVLRVGHLSAGIILGMREAICQMSLSFVSLTMGRLSSLTLRLAANGNNLPFFPFVHPTDDRLWPPYAPNNTTTGNDFVARGR